FCSEGLTAKDPAFRNGLRIIELAEQQSHQSEWTQSLEEAVTQGERAWQQAQSIDASLARPQPLEGEAKALKATIKDIEAKREELVQRARDTISADKARPMIADRLKKQLLETYQAYLRAEQRAGIKAIESLWRKYAVTAKQIEA